VVQKAVRELCEISAKLTDDLDAAQLDAATKRIDALTYPLGFDDIRALISLLPQDGDTASGLNWSILHAIEATPDWPLWDTLGDERSEWVRIFRLRLANGGFSPPIESDSASA
jgi:hypothetical protein